MAGFHVRVVDTLRPEVARWQAAFPVQREKGARAAGNLIRNAARRNITMMLPRRRGLGPLRRGWRFSERARSSVRLKIEKQEGLTTARVWSSFGPASAYELGSLIPGLVIRPRAARVLAFEMGGATMFRRFARRPAFRLPVRRWLTSALEQNRAAVLAAIEAEYVKTFGVQGIGGGAGG